MTFKSRRALLALVAVCALGAIASASASAALPEFANGPKEQLPATFKGAGGESSWTLRKEHAWSCSSSTMTGSVVGVKTITGATIVFSGCKVEGTKCHSEGSAAEEIKTEPLEGTLVYQSKSTKAVAIDFKAQAGTAIVRKLLCFRGSSGEVRGSIVMPITNVNKLATTFSLVAEGEKEKGYENEKGEKEKAGLEDNLINGFEPLYSEFNANIETNKRLEIKA